jgi:hypothetical protein
MIRYSIKNVNDSGSCVKITCKRDELGWMAGGLWVQDDSQSTSWSCIWLYLWILQWPRHRNSFKMGNGHTLNEPMKPLDRIEMQSQPTHFMLVVLDWLWGWLGCEKSRVRFDDSSMNHFQFGAQPLKLRWSICSLGLGIGLASRFVNQNHRLFLLVKPIKSWPAKSWTSQYWIPIFWKNTSCGPESCFVYEFSPLQWCRSSEMRRRWWKMGWSNPWSPSTACVGSQDAVFFLGQDFAEHWSTHFFGVWWYTQNTCGVWTLVKTCCNLQIVWWIPEKTCLRLVHGARW